MTSVYMYYAHVEMNAIISQIIKLIVSSYDFICSNIVVDIAIIIVLFI